MFRPQNQRTFQLSFVICDAHRRGSRKFWLLAIVDFALFTSEEDFLELQFAKRTELRKNERRFPISLNLIRLDIRVAD